MKKLIVDCEADCRMLIQASLAAHHHKFMIRIVEIIDIAVIVWLLHVH
jgi:hypothetical protein